MTNLSNTCLRCGAQMHNFGTAGFQCPNYICRTPTINLPYVAPFVQKGWQCPCCSRVWSPFTAECQPCNALRAGQVTITSGSGPAAPVQVNPGDHGSGGTSCQNNIAPFVRNS